MKQKKIATGVRFHPQIFKEIDKILKHIDKKYKFNNIKTRSKLIESFVIKGINDYWDNKE
jgi:hypothetical protein